MKTLPETFKKSGFTYTLVKRIGMVAIYRQTKQGQDWERFEVGRIRENQQREQFGVVIESKESWPTSEEWGIRAWTYTHLEAAKRRMAILTSPKPANP